jgi:hypothetical protein
MNFFFLENLIVYEITWENTVGPNRPQMTAWRVRIACWIPKATDTHSESVMVIAVTLHQWLRHRSSVLRFYVYCLPCALLTLCVLSQDSSVSTVCVGYSANFLPGNTERERYLASATV